MITNPLKNPVNICCNIKPRIVILLPLSNRGYTLNLV